MKTPVDIMISQLGVFEATGNNDGVPAERYMKGDELAWCAGVLEYAFEESDWTSLYDSENDGITDLGDLNKYYEFRSVQGLEDGMKEVGVFFGHELRLFVEPGDIIFYKNRGRSDPSPGGRHVGLVEFVEQPSLVIHTIKGNLGNAVRRRTVQPGDNTVAGFARWR